MTTRDNRDQHPDDDFRRIIEGNDWENVPRDDEDAEPWADEIPWEPAEQPPTDVPLELYESDEDESYNPDPGEITRGVSAKMVRAVTVILAVLVIMIGLAALPGSLPTVVWAAGVAGVIGGLYLVYRALPEDPRDDDGAVV